MELIQRRCNVCQSEDYIEVFQQRFNSIVGFSDLDYVQRLVICKNCGYTYTNPSPSPNELGKYYETLSNYENPLRQGQARRESMNRWHMIYDMIAKHAAPGRVLDIGCATGNGLSVFKSKGWEVLGLDPSPRAAQIAWELYGVEVISGIFDTKHFINRGHFDLIIFSSVLEHLNYPDITIDEIKDIIAAGGLVFIEVPNLLCPAIPFGYFTFEHLNYFTPTTLTTLMEMKGYSLEQIELLDTCKENDIDYPAIHAIFKAGNLKEVNLALKSDYIAAYNTVINYKKSLEKEVFRLQSRIGEITQQTAPGKLGIWGAGIHTSELLSSTTLANEKIACIFDSDPKKQGKLLNGVQVVSLDKPEEVKKRLDGIIISSFAFENEIYNQIKYLQDYGINVYKLYDV
ncbi:MAG: methyltransferase domain-containing protein [Thermodesulfobacteriota bacterium]